MDVNSSINNFKRNVTTSTSSDKEIYMAQNQLSQQFPERNIRKNNFKEVNRRKTSAHSNGTANTDKKNNNNASNENAHIDNNNNNRSKRRISSKARKHANSNKEDSHTGNSIEQVDGEDDDKDDDDDDVFNNATRFSLLNNVSPSTGHKKTELSGPAFINNDLRSSVDSKSGARGGKKNDVTPTNGYANSGTIGVGVSNNKNKRAKGTRRSKTGEMGDGTWRLTGLVGDQVKGLRPLWDWAEPVFGVALSWIRFCFIWLTALIVDVAQQSYDVICYCAKHVYYRTQTASCRLWTWFADAGHALKHWMSRIHWKFWTPRPPTPLEPKSTSGFGLDERMPLPETGEEAMRRLLSCRGQDAYSILGLPANCTNEDIRRSYKKLAVLVHPDKNPQSGADEAFKVLAHAFDFIGVPEKRLEYDLKNIHRTKAMKEFDEMLEKLKDKMEEALNVMNCDCGGKHKRYKTKRERSDARYCSQCRETHSVRDGDIWAESKWFGLLWYFYACMDGAIFDITEWAGCKKNNLKHMKANVHQVQYRLFTGKNRQQHSQPSGGGKQNAERSRLFDAQMEDLFRRLGDMAGSPMPNQDNTAATGTKRQSSPSTTAAAGGDNEQQQQQQSDSYNLPRSPTSTSCFPPGPRVADPTSGHEFLFGNFVPPQGEQPRGDGDGPTLPKKGGNTRRRKGKK